MPTKYYQNISKGIKVIERTSFCLRTDRRTDRRTDGQTDGRQADRYIPRSFSGRGIKMYDWEMPQSHYHSPQTNPGHREKVLYIVEG